MCDFVGFQGQIEKFVQFDTVFKLLGIVCQNLAWISVLQIPHVT